MRRSSLRIMMPLSMLGKNRLTSILRQYLVPSGSEWSALRTFVRA